MKHFGDQCVEKQKTGRQFFFLAIKRTSDDRSSIINLTFTSTARRCTLVSRCQSNLLEPMKQRSITKRHEVVQLFLSILPTYSPRCFFEKTFMSSGLVTFLLYSRTIFLMTPNSSLRQRGKCTWSQREPKSSNFFFFFFSFLFFFYPACV